AAPWSGHIRAAREWPTGLSRESGWWWAARDTDRRCATLLEILADQDSGWMSRSGGAGSPCGGTDTGLSTSAKSTGWSGPLSTEVFPGPLHRVRVPRLGAVPGRRVVLTLLEGVRRVLLGGDALGQVVRVHVPLRVAEFGRALVVPVAQVRRDGA